MATRLVCLPTGNTVTPADIARVCALLREITADTKSARTPDLVA